jgi:ABC-type antimicrobial peptide transport system permease subunit
MLDYLQHAFSLQLLLVVVGLVAVLSLLAVLGKVPLGYNLRNLSARWITTLMTALAFTLVIALLTVMLAFVNGMYRLTRESAQHENVIVLADGATDEVFSDLSRGTIGDLEYFEGVTQNADKKPLCSKETFVIVTHPLPDIPGQQRRRRFVQLRGVEDPVISGQVHGLSLKSGNWFSSAGVRAVDNPTTGTKDSVVEAVLGEGIAAQLGKDRGTGPLEAGEIFELAGHRWAVAGVVNSGRTTFGSEVWAMQSQVGTLFGKQTYTSVDLRAASEKDAAILAKNIKENYTKANLRPITEVQYYADLNQTNIQFTVAIIAVTIFIAIGGIFGVMNTMFAAISQRTKDIGVMRILGFQRWQILLSFVLESLAIALVGGLLGCALGSLSHGLTASSIVSSGAGGGKSIVLTLTVTDISLAIGMGLAVLMGLLGGLLPAISAMRLRPLEALR